MWANKLKIWPEATFHGHGHTKVLARTMYDYRVGPYTKWPKISYHETGELHGAAISFLSPALKKIQPVGIDPLKVDPEWIRGVNSWTNLWSFVAQFESATHKPYGPNVLGGSSLCLWAIMSYHIHHGTLPPHSISGCSPRHTTATDQTQALLHRVGWTPALLTGGHTA